ncbi:nucleotide-binding domain containing protein [Ectobacillus funiculus]|uniref:nucleotide-binding domain containing protein n=1 Tax=Ectobacillus funiculus TaxID=137993 RepID=UPI00397D46E8
MSNENRLAKAVFAELPSVDCKVAKGGITSSDIGTKGLQVQKATVVGQIKPGVPVWITGNESKFPAIAYIIFPGNVGTKTTLREVVETLNK